MSIKAVTDQNFVSEVRQSERPVLVEFGTQWCAPCKQIEPVLSELSLELEDRLKVVKIDVEQAPIAAQEFGIRGIPALFVFKDGEVVANKTGAASKRVLQDWVVAAI